jgi:hypothetical protein
MFPDCWLYSEAMMYGTRTSAKKAKLMGCVVLSSAFKFFLTLSFAFCDAFDPRPRSW